MMLLNTFFIACAAKGEIPSTGIARILASTTLFPDLTSFEYALLVQWTKITILSEDYQQTGQLEIKQHSRGGSPSGLNAQQV